MKAPATEDFIRSREILKVQSFFGIASVAMQEIAATSMLVRMMGFLPTMSIKKAFTEKRLLRSRLEN